MHVPGKARVGDSPCYTGPRLTGFYKGGQVLGQGKGSVTPQWEFQIEQGGEGAQVSWWMLVKVLDKEDQWIW